MILNKNIFGPKIFSSILVILLFGLFLVCGKDKPTGPNHETLPPSLLYTVPANTATNIGLDVIISSTFSEPIDSSSVNETSFSINNGVSGTYSQSGNTVYLTPSDSLEYLTTYTCALTTGITDSVGNHLTAGTSWTFTTVPDPATTSPTVVSVSPINNAVNIYGDAVITATFSKEMNAATLTNASFSLNNGATGTVTYSDKTATFTPDDTLLYDTSYTATISTAVADTFGNNMATAYSWNFRTITDPYIPLLSFAHPFDSAIVGDTVTIVADVTHPVGVDSVEFYIDDVIVSSATDLTAPYEYLLDASTWTIGSVHDIFTKACYGASYVGYSDTIGVIYKWEIMAEDNDEGLPQDLQRILARSTNSVMELRYEFYHNWSFSFPVTDEQVNDSIVNLGIYLDTDVNPNTGDQTFGDPGPPLNGIGANHRIILSSLIRTARDTALAFWNDIAIPPFWDLVFDTSGFNYINAPADTNFLEFGINWNDMNSSYGAFIVSFQAFIDVDTIGEDIDTTYYFDWIPNQGAGFVTVAKEARYIGAPFSAGKIIPIAKPKHETDVPRKTDNPFK